MIHFVLGPLALLAATLPAQQSASDPAAISINITFSPDAAKVAAARQKRAGVYVTYYCAPTAQAWSKVPVEYSADWGEFVPLGKDEQIVPAQPASITVPAHGFMRTRISSVRRAMVRVEGSEPPYNTGAPDSLNCSPVDGPLADTAKRPVNLSCRLWSEEYP